MDKPATVTQEAWDALMNAPVDFWQCPDHRDAGVSWSNGNPSCNRCGTSRSDEPKWSREDLQRVLYHVVRLYQNKVAVYGYVDEALHAAIYNVAIPTLEDNNWWPPEREIGSYIESHLHGANRDEPTPWWRFWR